MSSVSPPEPGRDSADYTNMCQHCGADVGEAHDPACDVGPERPLDLARIAGMIARADDALMFWYARGAGYQNAGRAAERDLSDAAAATAAARDHLREQLALDEEDEQARKIIPNGDPDGGDEPDE
jgi:hypothetical protein